MSNLKAINLKQSIIGVNGKPLLSTEQFIIVTKNGNDYSPVLDDAGIPVSVIRETPEKVLTLKEECVSLLSNDYKDEKPDEKRKVQKFELCMKVLRKSEIEFKHEDVALLVDLSNRANTSFKHGQFKALISGEIVDMSEEVEKIEE